MVKRNNSNALRIRKAITRIATIEHQLQMLSSRLKEICESDISIDNDQVIINAKVEIAKALLTL